MAQQFDRSTRRFLKALSAGGIAVAASPLAAQNRAPAEGTEYRPVKPVQPTDVITAVYQATTWNDGKGVEDTYGGKPEQGPLNTLIPAWQDALKDKPVGSRVLIIAPPDKAYPQDPGARKPHPAMGQTVVYVVDILYTTAGQ